MEVSARPANESAMTARLVILGGEGSGLIVADAVAAVRETGADVSLLGFLNDAREPGTRIGGFEVLGRFDEWRRLDDDVLFVAAFPKPREAHARHRRLASLLIPPNRWGTVQHPRAVVSASASIAHGCFIAPNAVVEAGAQIGPHGIVRAGAYVSHDVQIGAFAFVGPNASLLGRMRIGDGVHVGANAVCRDGLHIGDYAMIGIGSIVARDVAPFAVVAGNPARPVDTVERAS
jgi:sugar O-acyltransferase (sialic acid O-acetyltransferase NeuD family)